MILFNYLNTRVTLFDLWRRSVNKKKPGLKVGWCSYFPPAPNGAAAATYFSVKELVKNKGIDLYGIPLNGRLDKKLFSELGLTKVENNKLDAIIFFSLSLLIGRTLRRTKVKSIAWQTIHFGPDRYAPEKDLINQLKEADLLIALSRWAQDIYRHYGVKEVEYIPHGVDTSIFKPDKDKNKPPEVLFVGRLNYSKGIKVFLEMIPLVLAGFPEACFRLHAPKDIYSPYLNEIEAAVLEMQSKFPDNFVYIGHWMDYYDLSERYKGADILVFPSNNEGFGLPIIEAMSCEIPCIVADSPPMNEIVVNNLTGYCLPFNKDKIDRYHGILFPDPGEMAEKVLYLLNNKTVREQMGRKGRERAQAEYELSTCMDKMVSCVKQVSGVKNE